MKQACSFGSMGTQETYWALAQPTDHHAEICRDGVVVPPGETAQATPLEDRADDRDVLGVLWAPFFAEQRAAIARWIPHELRPKVAAALVGGAVDLWRTGRVTPTTVAAWLESTGGVRCGG